MKISLIQPKWRIETDSLCDPLNLGYLASFLRGKGCRDIKILSSVFDSDRKIIQSAFSSNLIGITATSSMMNHVDFLAKEIKNRNNKSIIVLGGVHASALPDKTLANKNIDFVIRGEGEESFYELVCAIDNKYSIDGLKGVSFNKGEDIFHGESRELIDNLDDIPYPARDLFIQESFIRRYYNVWGKRSVAVLSSRGCPYDCSPCASSVVWNRKWRGRSPENITEEIARLISEYNIEEVHFEDANFAISSERVIDICKLFIKRNLNIQWNCLVSPDIDSEVLKLMKYAGCKTIGVGVESGSLDILKDYGKGFISMKDVKNVFKVSKELNLNRIAFVVLGLPNEDRDTICETKKLLNDIKPDYVTCSLLTPFPGTKYYRLAEKQGYIKDNEWSKLYYTHAYMPTNHLSRKELQEEYKIFLRDILYCWRRRKLKLLPMYYKLKVQFKNTSPSGYIYLFYRIWKHAMLVIFNRLQLRDL